MLMYNSNFSCTNCAGRLLWSSKREALRIIGKPETYRTKNTCKLHCGFTYSVFNLGQLQPPFVLSLSKHERHTSTSSVRTVTL